MANVTHQAHARKEVRLRSTMDFTKFTMGIFGLEARSKAYIRKMEETDDFLDLVNHMQAVQARDWLVADSREQLDRYIPVIGSDEWHEAWANIRIEVIRPRTLSTGWTINR